MKTVQTHLKPEAFDLLTFLIDEYMSKGLSLRKTIEIQNPGKFNKKWVGFQKGQTQFYFEKLPTFIKGQWYTHTEPGQEKFLIRVEDPEKQICSGWDCKGKPFKNEWVHLGNRLQTADLNAGEASVLDIEIENFK